MGQLGLNVTPKILAKMASSSQYPFFLLENCKEKYPETSKKYSIKQYKDKNVQLLLIIRQNIKLIFGKKNLKNNKEIMKKRCKECSFIVQLFTNFYQVLVCLKEIEVRNL